MIVVGLGIQGIKRRQHAKDDFVASVDPVNPDANYKKIEEVPLTDYDAALCCVPDEPKIELLTYLFENKKHALVEKPLFSASRQKLLELEALAQEKSVIAYTAYNHRFEPHLSELRKIVNSGELGKIYHCRMFYGNGTARLVRDSAWRDKGAGVLPDLGSHLIDTAAYLFGNLRTDYQVVSSKKHENRAPDHVIINAKKNEPDIELEMTLLMWRNHFTCDILAENGSAHITSLCKWGPTTLTTRKRILPSGKPKETSKTLVQNDPTWLEEYKHFKHLVSIGAKSCLKQDIWLNDTLEKLGNEAVELAME